jgi:hypothetical protein
LLAFTVARRTHKIAVRVALGTTGRNVTSMVLRRALRLLSADLIIGLPDPAKALKTE